MQPIIYTIGHSTRTQQELIDLLRHYNVNALIDIRAIPYSGYNPQFNRETLMKVMPETGIRYEHLQEVGGKRPSQEVMAAAKSCSERSRGFAGHMQTEEFKQGINHIVDLANTGETLALMCAESEPSHCHRFWVADALNDRGATIRHIITDNDVREHPANLFTY